MPYTHFILTNLTRIASITACARTLVAVDEVYARATILAWVGCTFVDI